MYGLGFRLQGLRIQNSVCRPCSMYRLGFLRLVFASFSDFGVLNQKNGVSLVGLCGEGCSSSSLLFHKT